MGEWKDEEQIKAELRLLTRQLRELRGELTDLLSPPKPSRARALLHRKGWPGEPSDDRDSADDRDRKSHSSARPPEKG